MIRIIVDSSTMLTVEEGKKMNIDVVPLSVTIDGKTYREYEEITAQEFNEIIGKGHVPTSSQPAIGEFVDLFEKYKDDEIVVITMADGLSGTYQSCLSAKEMVNRDDIVVINSTTLSLPHRLVVLDAIMKRDEGASFSEIVEMVEAKIKTAISFLLPQDFEYLKRGGRLTPLAAKLSGLLKIQPVLTQSEDGTRLERFTVGRNFNIGVNKVLNYFKALNLDASYRFCISHAFVQEQAEAVASRIKTMFNVEHVEIDDLSCAFITQGGPQCLAIQVISK